MQPRSNLQRRTFPNLPYLSGNLLCRTAPKPSCRTILKFPCRIRSPYFPFFSFPVRTLIFIPSLTPASFWSVPFFSGFTPVFVLHPYARIRSYFRFFPNPVPLLSALLLLPSFIIPAFALIDIFTPYSFFFYVLNVCISRQMQTYRPGRKACVTSGWAFEFRDD